MILVVLGWLLALTMVYLWLKANLRYRVGSKYFKIMVFRFCIRRIELTNIRRVSKRKVAWSENWTSVWKTNHRLLTLHLHEGWRKAIRITPKNRYILIADLKAGLARVKAESGAERQVADLEVEMETPVPEKSLQNPV